MGTNLVLLSNFLTNSYVHALNKLLASVSSVPESGGTTQSLVRLSACPGGPGVERKGKN